MRKRIATACYRELGAELSKHREAAGRSRTALARDFGCAPSHISRIESGHAPVSEVDVIHYLGLCGVYLKDAHELLAMCRAAERSTGYWYAPHEPELNDSMHSLIYHESTAIASTSYEPLVIPGLLQTESYIRALTTERWPSHEIEHTVRVRRSRQRILHRSHPAQFTYFLHEHSVRLMVGDPVIMHEQVLALLLLDGLPHVGIRVVPASAEAQALFGGEFRLLTFAGHRPLVYLDAPFGGLFLEDREYVDSYRELIPVIAEVALNGGQSREFLATLANDYDRERADLDEYAQVEEEQL